ncbi:hypothetical protein LLG07_06105 [bacterium]|nr:hypothetical protein [bacterium]
MNDIAMTEPGVIVMTIDEAKGEFNELQRFVKSVMKEGSDYGIVPGTEKPTLLKPGAEKLAHLYGLTSEVEFISSVEDWDKPFFNYVIKTKLFHFKTGIKVAEGIGSCNSYEARYRYRWVFESELSEYDKANKDELKRKEFYSKKQGKNYVMYRVLNDDIYSQINTIQKMAEKRSYVDAVLKATRTSDSFTQDMEDIVDYKPIRNEQKIKENKKELLEKIAELRDAVGMKKEELTNLVEEKFKTNDASKLSLEQLTTISDMLEEKLTEDFDDYNNPEQQTL